MLSLPSGFGGRQEQGQAEGREGKITAYRERHDRQAESRDCDQRLQEVCSRADVLKADFRFECVRATVCPSETQEVAAHMNELKRVCGARVRWKTGTRPTRKRPQRRFEDSLEDWARERFFQETRERGWRKCLRGRGQTRGKRELT